MDTPGGPTDPDLGQANYEAARAVHPAGAAWPSWGELHAGEQDAWIAGALAVKSKLGAPKSAA